MKLLTFLVILLFSASVYADIDCHSHPLATCQGVVVDNTGAVVGTVTERHRYMPDKPRSATTEWGYVFFDPHGNIYPAISMWMPGELCGLPKEGAHIAFSSNSVSGMLYSPDDPYALINEVDGEVFGLVEIPPTGSSHYNGKTLPLTNPCNSNGSRSYGGWQYTYTKIADWPYVGPYTLQEH